MPTTGHFVLRSSVLPPVTAGSYELLSGQDGTPFSVSTQRTNVTVSAPRYTMPTDQILSSFPPANAEGAFGDRLPQIVLKRRTLPWERNPFGGVDPVTTPWLALVVVAEGEAELSAAPRPVADCVTPGVTLPNPGDRDVEQGYCLSVTETVVKKIFPCQEDLALLSHVREVDINDTELANGDDDGFLAVVLANRLPVFDTANQVPVRYQACLVNLEGQLHELPPPSPPVPDFTFELAQDWSVLATIAAHPDVYVAGGARFEASQRDGITVREQPTGGAALDGTAGVAARSAASQWSMSSPAQATAAITAAAADPNAASVVRDAMRAGFHYPISVYAQERVLSFPVLAHWSFTTSEGATFETLMQDLDVGLLGTLPVPDPDDPPAPTPSTVIATGHLQLEHRTRRGDTSQAWYRGPFVPHPTDRERPDSDGLLSVAHSADHLRRVVPDGREDLSYSAAFEIGRLLALSQLSVTASLLRFRQDQFGVARLRALTRDALPWGLDLPAGARDLGHLVSAFVVDRLSREPVAFAGPSRPVADPGRPIDGLAGLDTRALDELVARGLGLDLAALERASQTVGVVAALGSMAVPVAQRDGVDATTFAALQDGLTSEVLRLAEMAVPGIGTPPPGGGGPLLTPDAERARDALDDLIDALEETAPGEDRR
jgi:hypothetical protein